MSFLLVGLIVVLALAFSASWHRRADLRHQREVVEERAQMALRGKDAAPLQVPVIDLSTCLGCGACVRACPEDGVLQLVAKLGGRNLDALFLNPVTGGAASINIWGAVGQSSVYRVNALTGDANHLGVMLVVPLLLLTPVYLRLEPGHRLRLPLAVLLGFLLLVELATLSRSGLLGLACGGLVLAVVYRRLLLSRALLIPLGAVAAVLLFIVTRRLSYFSNILHARLQTSDSSSTLHFQVYDFIPQTIHAHPLFGFGLNTATEVSWGSLLSNSKRFIVSEKWWMVVFPSMALLLTILAINFMGDGLRDALDPKQNRNRA